VYASKQPKMELIPPNSYTT